MSKRKVEVHDEQLDFFEFVPLSRDVQDAMLEKEVYKDSGRRIYRDDHPLLMAYREAYFDEWCRRYPDGYLAKYSQWRE